VIPWQHSLDLINTCNCPAKLITPELMQHNNFDISKDILYHIQEFLSLFTQKFDDSEDLSGREEMNSVHFPLFMYIDPTC
jgi:hypothetical protein